MEARQRSAWEHHLLQPVDREPHAATLQETDELQTWMTIGTFASILILRTLIDFTFL